MGAVEGGGSLGGVGVRTERRACQLVARRSGSGTFAGLGWPQQQQV